MAPHELKTLFEAFGQTESGLKAREGSGLGLPISQKFVQMMGGKITVKSQIGQGSLFSFDIQIRPADEAIAETEPPVGRKVIGLAPDQPTYRILIAEDKEVNRLLLVRLLKPLGFEVQTVENGQEAIAAWEHWQPHLIWMDMQMPVMNGYEATQWIKSSLQGQATIIIALTASVFEEQRQTILSTGCDDFLAKPFRENDLLEKIRHHLGVKYIYEEINNREATNEENQNFLSVSFMQRESSFILHPSFLEIMSPAWRNQLYLAASQCSDRLIFELIAQIPPENAALATALTDLTDNFRFDQLADLARPGEG
ncbi:response regulator [Kovacikia minuta CCNUW1]|uniref:ATP-binding response regulator n=1 Tax=Kovacikia minuta TaxID=2931930 RepID=UPI001CCA02F8|nr:response regulator [Kovacikia minuta]UBF29649.1 response regulator [Kovacikia minuta CCNUW1]